jgi:hypothetical protein
LLQAVNKNQFQHFLMRSYTEYIEIPEFAASDTVPRPAEKKTKNDPNLMSDEEHGKRIRGTFQNKFCF